MSTASAFRAISRPSALPITGGASIMTRSNRSRTSSSTCASRTGMMSPASGSASVVITARPSTQPSPVADSTLDSPRRRWPRPPALGGTILPRRGRIMSPSTSKTRRPIRAKASASMAATAVLPSPARGDVTTKAVESGVAARRGAKFARSRRSARPVCASPRPPFGSRRSRPLNGISPTTRYPWTSDSSASPWSRGRMRSRSTVRPSAETSPPSNAPASNRCLGGAAALCGATACTTCWPVSSLSRCDSWTASSAKALAAAAARDAEGSRTVMVTIPVAVAMLALTELAIVLSSTPTRRATAAAVCGAKMYATYFGATTDTVSAPAFTTPARGANATTDVPSKSDGSTDT
jgi:hypothetical protein